jgi:aminoglycoside phosphotransferase (APT) family kinase protein
MLPSTHPPDQRFGGEGDNHVRAVVDPNRAQVRLRAGHQSRIRPWVEVAQVAAALHRMPGADWSGLLPGPPTRRLHAVEESHVLDGLDVPEASDARAWATENLLPEEPSVFLHGILLGQNILLQLEGPRAVIDWEYARLGDPASDLAIVTRGVRKPFQIEGRVAGLQDAYREAGGAAVEARQVRLFELCMAAKWLRETMRSPDQAGVLEQARQRFRVVLELVLKS